MKKTTKQVTSGVSVALIVMVALVLVMYRDEIMGALSIPSPAELKNEEIVIELRELIQEARYMAPSGEDHVRFTVVVDSDGVIQGAKSVNLEDPGNVHQIEFSKNLTKMIKGKKLSELGAVDKVGTASLTTAAFNEALVGLKAQL